MLVSNIQLINGLNKFLIDLYIIKYMTKISINQVLLPIEL